MEDILMGLVTDKCSETSFFTSDLPGFEKQPYNIKKIKINWKTCLHQIRLLNDHIMK